MARIRVLVVVLSLVVTMGVWQPVFAGFRGATTSPGNVWNASTAFDFAAGVAYENPDFFLRLNDGPGAGTLADASGRNRPGVNLTPDSGQTAALYQVAGLTGDGDTAARFDGRTGMVYADRLDPVTVTDFSIEVWFRTLSTTGGVLAGVSRGLHFSPDDQMMYVDSGNRITVGDYDNGMNSVRSAGTVNDGAWHHAVATRSGGTLTLYVDGVAQGSTSYTGAPLSSAWVAGGLNYCLCGWPDAPASTYLDGSIDEFATYRYGLDPARIAAHRSAAAGASYRAAVLADDPAVYWRLNEPAISQTAADSSGNGITGTYYLGDRAVGGQSGALVTKPDDAMYFPGTSGSGGYVATVFASPQPITALMWFKTRTPRGGILFQFASAPTGNASNYDRTVLVHNNGTLTFGVFNGSVRTADSAASFNDGQWHLVAATLGPDGQHLYVDGVRVATNANTVTSETSTGYWRIGQGDLRAWPDTPDSWELSGWMDEFAVLPTQLSGARIAQLYSAR